MLLHFHLTAKWFERIKFGEKDIEWRSSRQFSLKRVNVINDALKNGDLKIRFYLGYPRKNDTSRFFDCVCTHITCLYLSELPNAERNFFVEQGLTYGLFYGFHVVRV